LHDTPVMGIPDVITPLPRPFKAMMFWLVDRLMIDKHLAPGVNAYRAELGLPPVHRLFKSWLHSPELVVNLFPEWYSAPQPDWPPNTYNTGFPLFDETGVREIPSDVAAFLDEGEAPIVFTAGSAMAFSRRFLADSVEICRKLNRRGILLTQFADQVPAELPPTVRHFDYIPFSQVLPLAAAVVHHGGIGTTAQAFAAGVPQLVTPFAHDQPDNAHRVKRLGAGDFVLPPNYAGEGLPAIRRLIEATAIKQRCEELAARLRGADPIDRTCDLIESIA
jgi:UDP:flavonoid glycosyltransferase YjiC (YdhE family)